MMVLCCAICELIEADLPYEWIYECPICHAQYSVWKDEKGELHLTQIREGTRRC